MELKTKRGKTDSQMNRRIDEAHSRMDRWIAEENLRTEAKRMKARIGETAQKAEYDFWEIIMGSFPEIANVKLPTEVASGFSKACCEAVTAWYLANTKLDDKLRALITSKKEF